MGDYILGLDLGPNSIGWAMLKADPESGEPGGFADTETAGHPPMGARVFEAGLDNFDTSKEKSLNQARRTARSMRRNHARRNARRRQMRSLLEKAGLLPIDQNQLSELFQTDPFELRAHALQQALSPHELGRALLHLCQRRGFKSNRKGEKAKEDKGILEEIGSLEKEITETGCKTLGEFLHSLNRDSADPKRAPLRKRHTRRDMYEVEFQAIVARQKETHANILTDEFVETLHEKIFFQHPFEITEERRQNAPSRANLHRAPSVKACPLEPDEKCGPRGDWKAQQFRILKETANLRISEHHGPERHMKDEEKKLVLESLFTKERVKFDELRKTLGKIGMDPDARFNLERGERKALQGNSVEHQLAAKFGRKKWEKTPLEIKEELRHLLVHSEDETELKSLLMEAGLAEEKAIKLVSWAPADGYLGYSLKALGKILPFLEEGMDEYEAVLKAYPDRPAFGMVDSLPPLSSPDIPPELDNLTNPVVRRALVEVRKVLNALIREHGRPLRIVVEMAREMKSGPKGRKEFNKKIREREAMRADAAVQVKEFGGNPAARSDINRWLYWKEQGEYCIYTGRPIPASELFHGGEWEVDHILPRWRSLDDSMMNKVLVHRLANAEKGDRTPAEWLGAESEAFKQLLRRADAELRTKNLPYPKFRRLGTRELNTDAFALRQLNDTRYLTTLVVSYVSLLYPPELRTGEKAVQTCKGGLTAELRRQWGLNNILPPLYNADGKPILSSKTDTEGIPYKSRDDHRHHAVDAVVIALSTRKFLKGYQDYWKVKETRREAKEPQFPSPWPEFRADVKDMASRINVSHRAMKKLSGALHEETFYGPARDHSGELIVDRYVTRKKLGDLTGKMVENIRDLVVRRIVSERLKNQGWDGKNNALPKDWHTEPLSVPSGVPIRKVRVETSIKNAVRLKHRYAVLGNNHHMEIVGSEKLDENGRPEKMWATVVLTMEASRRVRRERGQSTLRDHGPGKQFLMSLSRKESVWAINPVTGERVICIIQKLSGSPEASGTFNFYLRDSRDSRPASEGNLSPFKIVTSFKAWHSLELKKIQVDPIGRTNPAND